MSRKSVRAEFYGGGMSKPVMFNAADLGVIRDKNPMDMGAVPAICDVLIGNSCGVLPVQASVTDGPDGPVAHSATTFRTQRRIMEGRLPYPEALEAVT